MRIPFFKSKPPYTVEEIQAWEDILAARKAEGDYEGIEMAREVLHFYLQELEHWVMKQKKPSLSKQVEALLKETRKA